MRGDAPVLSKNVTRSDDLQAACQKINGTLAYCTYSPSIIYCTSNHFEGTVKCSPSLRHLYISSAHAVQILNILSVILVQLASGDAVENWSGQLGPLTKQFGFFPAENPK